MRGYFDNGEPEEEELEEVHESRRDREVTLSTAAQLGIVFCLLLLCGACFGLGYWVGHGRSAGPATTAANQPAPPTAAPDQEPLQGSDNVPKPSADAQAPPTQEPPPSDGTTPASPQSGTTPAPTSPTPAPAEAPASKPSAPANPPAEKPASPAPAHPSTPVHTEPPPRLPAPSRASEPEDRPIQPRYRPSSPAIRPAPSTYAPAATQYMVQIAAVSHFEDANVLVEALRRRGFAAIEQHSSSDGLIHVRVGPFATHEEANRMCTRLLESGYNAMVQP